MLWLQILLYVIAVAALLVSILTRSTVTFSALKSVLYVDNIDNMQTKSRHLAASDFKFVYRTLIVTGANDLYFDALKTQIASIHRFDEKNVVDQIIVLDLGLNEEYLKELETLERITVLKFPTTEIKFPEQVQPKSYAWKYPFIVYVTKRFQAKNVFWLDAGACFMKSVNNVFNVIDKVGCLFVEDIHINKDFTHSKCIEILQASEEELMAHQLCAGIAGYRTDSDYARVFEETAFFSGIKECVFDMLDKDVSYKAQNIKSHRHDQSILSILVSRYKCPVQDLGIFGEFIEQNVMAENSKAVIYVHRGAYRNFNGLKIKV